MLPQRELTIYSTPPQNSNKSHVSNHVRLVLMADMPERQAQTVFFRQLLCGAGLGFS
jgi:hypothetical protein